MQLTEVCDASCRPYVLRNIDAATTPLLLHQMPICLTCAVYESHVLLDPTPEEAQCSSGTISIALNADDSLCLMLTVMHDMRDVIMGL